MKYNVTKIHEFGVVHFAVYARNAEQAEQIGETHDIGALCDIEIEESEQ